MALGRTARNKLAMTGELTLTGQVLPIGGVKEKVIAARRARYKDLVFPEANRKDVEELPEYLSKGIRFHFADRYDDVFEIALGR
jgi:ATP-dependent Lon protease